jgi:hypothetical protein
MNSLPEHISTKTALLDEIIAERKLIETVLDRIGGELGEDQLVLPILHDHWSVKDTFAHITEWELAMIKCLKTSLSGETVDWPPFGMSAEQVNQINTEWYQRNKRKPLGQVLDESQDSYILVLETIRSVTENDLFKPERFSWLEGKPFWPIIAANTCWHYKEHRHIFEKLLL